MEINSIWILTREINAYNQEGEDFIKFFTVMIGFILFVVDFLYCIWFIANCMDDTIKFNFKIPIPFIGFIKQRKVNKEVKNKIALLELELIEATENDSEFNKILTKIESLEKRLENK